MFSWVMTSSRSSRTLCSQRWRMRWQMKAAPPADTCPGPAPWTAELLPTSRGVSVLILKEKWWFQTCYYLQKDMKDIVACENSHKLNMYRFIEQTSLFVTPFYCWQLKESSCQFRLTNILLLKNLESIYGCVLSSFSIERGGDINVKFISEQWKVFTQL